MACRLDTPPGNTQQESSLCESSRGNFSDKNLHIEPHSDVQGRWVFFSSLKPAPHQLPVCDPQPDMSASELMGCLSDDLLPSSSREGQLELPSKSQMVLVFAFLGAQLVLEHALASLAINGGNKMLSQGGGGCGRNYEQLCRLQRNL